MEPRGWVDEVQDFDWREDQDMDPRTGMPYREEARTTSLPEVASEAAQAMRELADAFEGKHPFPGRPNRAQRRAMARANRKRGR